MIKIAESKLDQCYRLLRESNFTVHEAVIFVFVHGSRSSLSEKAPRGNSDIDLLFLVDENFEVPKIRNRYKLFFDVLNTTIKNWKGPVETDLSILFSQKDNCVLSCVSSQNIVCPYKTQECMGTFKIQKGFSGYIPQYFSHPDQIKSQCLLPKSKFMRGV